MKKNVFHQRGWRLNHPARAGHHRLFKDAA